MHLDDASTDGHCQPSNGHGIEQMGHQHDIRTGGKALNDAASCRSVDLVLSAVRKADQKAQGGGAAMERCSGLLVGLDATNLGSPAETMGEFEDIVAGT
jgi:hypothetical protein